ncbi:hypothetical protein PR202_ga08647 [Eleusine coracana subsp. coracana]|uniref:Uncharacterized protein n=1 Tax=Eleusine coracana subsp. coracana TaxID=191504 RepID=A0AAV5C0L1_ELECO|nr:hypothetical protein PR202_ga08647 [Eleusine coracana subsp. coracana]
MTGRSRTTATASRSSSARPSCSARRASPPTSSSRASAARRGGRLAAGAGAVRVNTPRVVASFAAFSGVYCAAERALSVARGGKDDDWNSIAAGVGATALKHSRRGAFVAARAGLIGGSLVIAFYSALHAASDWVDRRTNPCRRAAAIKPVATPQLQSASTGGYHILRMPLLPSQCTGTSQFRRCSA